MKFSVHRASSHSEAEAPPCEEARKEEVETKFNSTIQCWTIELSSLNDIVNFFRKYGDIILKESYLKDMPTIVIYDDYVE